MNGTYTLLLTDVVDSTRLAEELGDAAMAERWAAHDRVARDLLRVHRGREIDKTDGFLLLFSSAKDAAAYAAAYHRALEGLGLKARAGLHLGPVVLRENTAADVALGAKPLEVEGIAKPTAARVMSVATGGQTLATPEVLAALGLSATAASPDGHVRGDGLLAVSHGQWQLKGVTQPVELFELGVRGEARFVPPPDAPKAWRVRWQGDAWVPVREVKRSLPAERDAFVGREADLRALADRLDEGARLVTVLGIGGTGKTRLVTRFAWTWLGEYSGGAWFCDLAEARDLEGIARAVAAALEVPLGKEDPVAQLGHAIAARGPCLVVLDNFEQVARHAQETLGRWLDRAPNARFVVTTREVLGLAGENALALAPLQADESVALFVARATQAKRDFALTDAERPLVQALVKLLDGLPLAIELAAARVRVMPPKALLGRMSERFKLLASTGGRHTRQVTLRATLDWSWGLLPADEQQALAQLSVFEGGFSLESAEAVLALAQAWPMDAVQALVDKSLVRRVAEHRFDLLATVQEYAASQLDALGGRREAEARHASHFAARGTPELLEALDRAGGEAGLVELGVDLGNFVAATRRATARGEGEVAACTLGATWQVVGTQGPAGVAVALATALLAVPGLSRAAWVRASILLGQALLGVGKAHEAQAHLEGALAGARELGDRGTEAFAVELLGTTHHNLGRMEQARACYEEALAIARAVGDRAAEAHAKVVLAVVLTVFGRRDDAGSLLEESLAFARQVGDRRMEARALANLANVRADQGRVDQAAALYEEGRRVYDQLGDRRMLAVHLGNWGNLMSERGRLDDALARYHAALTIHREVGNRRSEGIVLGTVGIVHAGQGRQDAAGEHFHAALAVHREVGERRFEAVALAMIGAWNEAQGRSEEARAHFEAALVLNREVRDRVSEGHVLSKLGGLHGAAGRLGEARAHLEAAIAVLREVGAPRLEGITWGMLGGVAVAEGRPDEARACFDAGEALLRRVEDRVELGNLLCARARLDHAEGRSEAAHRALGEAVALLAEVGTGPDSALGRQVAATRAALGEA